MLPDMALVADGMALAFKTARRAAGGDDLLRRGLDRQRPVARGDELRRHPPAAGRLRAREQPASPTRPRTSSSSRSTRSSAPRTYGFPGVQRRRQRRRGGVRGRRGSRPSAPARGDGPTLIECRTMRMHGHGAHDDMSYVPAGDARGVGASATRSSATRERLVAEHGFAADEVEAIRAEVKRLRRRVRRRRRSPRRCPTRRSPREGVFADDCRAARRRPGAVVALGGARADGSGGMSAARAERRRPDGAR